MIPLGKPLLAAFASVIALGLWRLFQFMYQRFTSPIRHLRGPKGTSWTYGNLRDIWNAVCHFLMVPVMDLDSTNPTVLARF
jgi:hypothetical protein